MTRRTKEGRKEGGEMSVGSTCRGEACLARKGTSNRRSRWSLAAGLAGVLLAAACGGSSSGSSSGQATGSPIKIGVLDDNAPITAVEGAEMRVNTDLAVAEINASGGIHGHRLQVSYVDPKAQPDEAITLAQQLVQQQSVDVLVGGVLSSGRRPGRAGSTRRAPPACLPPPRRARSGGDPSPSMFRPVATAQLRGI